MYEAKIECPKCDAPAWLRMGWNEPDPEVNYAGGGYAEEMECSEGHTIGDLSGAERIALEDDAYEIAKEEREAAREEYEERRMSLRRER